MELVTVKKSPPGWPAATVSVSDYRFLCGRDGEDAVISVSKCLSVPRRGTHALVIKY